MSFLERGEEVLNRVIAECEDVGKSESKPVMEGRYMRLMLTPITGSSSPKTTTAKPKGEE